MTNITSSNTANEGALLEGVINDIHTELHGIIDDLDEESVRFHVNRLWNCLSNGIDFRATTSTTETQTNMSSIKIDIIALQCLIMTENSTVINGLDVALRIIFQEATKTVEDSNVLDNLNNYLLVECLDHGPFSTSSNKRCEYIQKIIRIAEELETNRSLGIFCMLIEAVRGLDGFNHDQNVHIDPNLNSILFGMVEIMNNLENTNLN